MPAKDIFLSVKNILPNSKPHLPKQKFTLPKYHIYMPDKTREIRDIISQTKILCIAGADGTGKTELAKEYVNSYKHLYKSIYYVSYADKDSLRLTIADLAFDKEDTSTKNNIKEKYATKLGYLKENDFSTLIIIDDYNPKDFLEDDKEVMKDLEQLDTHFIFISRKPYGDYVNVDIFSTNDLRYLYFDLNSRDKDNEFRIEKVEKLVSLSNHNIFTVTLLANILKRTSIDEALKALKNYSAVGFDYTSKYDEEESAVLRNISKLVNFEKFTRMQRYILRNAALIPYTGMNIFLFMQILDLEDEQQMELENLIASGWIMELENNKIALHPVVSEVIINELELEIRPGKCEPFAEYIYDIIEKTKEDYKKAEHYVDMIFRIGDIFADLEIPEDENRAYDTATLFNNLGYFCNMFEFYEKSIKYYNKDIEITKSMYDDEEDTELSSTYNNIATAYDNIGEIETALKYKKKALDIREQYLPPNHLAIGSLYKSIGNIYNKTGNQQLALENLEKAQTIYKYYPEKKTSLAALYSLIGNIHKETGNTEKATEYFEKTTAIYSQMPDKKDGLASNYNNLANTYFENNNFEKTIDYFTKELKIVEKDSNYDELKLSDSYHKLGLTYFNMKNYDKASEYLTKAFEIRGKLLPASDPKLAETYDALGKALDQTGNHEKALDFKLKAIEILKDTSTENQDELALSYKTIAKIYYNKGDYNNTIEYLKKAIDIYKVKYSDINTTPEMVEVFDLLGNAYAGIGDSQLPDDAVQPEEIVYIEVGNNDNALIYLNQVLSIREKTLPADSPKIAKAHQDIANVYYNTNQFDKALRTYEKALEILKQHQEQNEELNKLYIKIIDTAKKWNNLKLTESYQAEYELFNKNLNENNEEIEQKIENSDLNQTSVIETNK